MEIEREETQNPLLCAFAPLRVKNRKKAAIAAFERRNIFIETLVLYLILYRNQIFCKNLVSKLSKIIT